MKLIESSIRFPVTVIVGVLIAIMAGLIALFGVPVQLSPEVERPVITVTTNWFGASPVEIEKEIVEQQEEYLKSVEGVLKMESQSQDGQGTITLEFAVGTDITGALVKVTNKLNEVPSYPENADEPIVTASGPFEGAIAWFVITSTDGKTYVPHVQTMVEDLVKPRLERVEGVSKINVFGGIEQELHVDFDPEYLASIGITVNQLANALRVENQDISAGDFSEGKRRYVVRTVSRFETEDDVRQTVVTVRNGVPIRVGDVANVELGYRKATALVRQFGHPALAMNAQRQVGSNVLQVMEGLNKQVAIINEEILHPRHLNLESVYAETLYINSAINLVFNNIFLGGILAVIALFLFLRSVTSILIVGVSIPISIIAAFFMMFVLGRSINVISLAGIAFAVGMVVDSSIVVLENIYRHMQMGKSRLKAAYEGTTEVWGALLASASTTIAVFLPVVFIQERAGQLFRDIAIAISAAIAISLLVSITVIPTFAARILRVASRYKNYQNDQTNVHKTFLERFADRIAGLVDYINARLLRRLVVTIGIVVVALGLTLVLMPPTEYLPNGNQNFVLGYLLPPPGYNLDEMLTVGQSIEKQLSSLWETPPEKAKDLPGGGIDNFFIVLFQGQAFMGLRAREQSRARELLPVANGALFSIPGAIGFANQASLFERGFAGSRSVRLDVTGPDLNKVLQIATRVFGQIGQVLPGANSRPIPGLDLGNPEVRVHPDRVRAADMGFSASQIGNAVNALVDGAIVSDYWYEGRELDLVLRGKKSWTQHTQDISQLPMATPSGRIITLGDVARVDQQQGPVQINHVERQRAVSIESTLPNDIPLEEAIARVEQQIIKPLRDQGVVSGSYDIRLSGTADDLSRLKTALFTRFNLAVILTFLLLAALFQSFIYPLVIILTVPLATFGGMLGLRIVQIFDHSLQLDVLTMLGFVILVGTVINNAILIVHMALQLIREGWDQREALKQSVRFRVRPIFMSTGTSIFGMLPLVVMPGAGSELYRGLGSVVIGGLALSAVITLLLTPLVFSLTMDIVAWIRRILGMKERVASSAPEIETSKS